MTVQLHDFPRQMWYLTDSTRYASRKLVNVDKVEVMFPDGIAPQLYIHGIAEDGSFAVSDDGKNFRLPHKT